MRRLDPLLPESEVDTDHRPALEWPTDPWDDPDGTGSVERLRHQSTPIKWIAYTLMTLVIVAILIAGAVGWWYLQRLNPDGPPGDAVSFTITADDDLRSLSERLHDEGIVSDPDIFEWYVEREGGLEIIPGYYQLRPDDHVGNVLGRLRTPPSQTTTKVTFPEGFTIDKMATRLETTVPRLSAEEFRAAANDPAIPSAWRPPGVTTMQGLLFPDTYEVSNAESETQVIERMVALMERVGEQEDIETLSAARGLTPYQILIVASMIEREAAVPEDRAKIARVIYNRLFFGTPLDIDAAVLYGAAEAGLDLERPFSELRQIDGPYNTYLRVGLPPTPIANPGRASIRAALNPAPNPAPGDPICRDLPNPNECTYLFYVLADADGSHAFSATSEQHDANVQRALEAGLL